MEENQTATDTMTDDEFDAVVTAEDVHIELGEIVAYADALAALARKVKQDYGETRLVDADEVAYDTIRNIAGTASLALDALQLVSGTVSVIVHREYLEDDGEVGS